MCEGFIACICSSATDEQILAHSRDLFAVVRWNNHPFIRCFSPIDLKVLRFDRSIRKQAYFPQVRIDFNPQKLMVISA